jgi:rRNA-processing protein FCF1
VVKGMRERIENVRCIIESEKTELEMLTGELKEIQDSYIKALENIETLDQYDEIIETLEDKFNEACENLIVDILYTNDKIFSKISELRYLELKEAEYLEEKEGVANV